MEGRVLICGVGSIGRRHLSNLQSLGHKQLLLYRTGHSTLPEESLAALPVSYDLQEALAQNPIAAVIANPTSLHMPTALAAGKAGCSLLLEKPVSHNLDGTEELARIVASKQLQVLVGFQFRFHPGLRRVKQLLEEGAIGRPVSVQAHWGEYLPGWHSWEDYRKGYSARADLGGGVLLTLCHPFDYLRWLLGEVSGVSAIESKRGLELPVEDTVDVLLSFSTGVLGYVHLDYVQRPPSHWLQITGQQGLIRWDNSDGAVHLHGRGSSDWEAFPAPKDFGRNTMFLDEMNHFLACLAGREEPVCSLQDGIAALRIVLAAKESVREQRMVLL